MTEAEVQAQSQRLAPHLPETMLHSKPEINLRLWTALVFHEAAGLQLSELRPSTTCTRAGLCAGQEPYWEGRKDGFNVGTKSSLSSSVGTPALRKLVKAGLTSQEKHAGSYSMTPAGLQLLDKLRAAAYSTPSNV